MLSKKVQAETLQMSRKRKGEVDELDRAPKKQRSIGSYFGKVPTEKMPSSMKEKTVDVSAVEVDSPARESTPLEEQDEKKATVTSTADTEEVLARESTPILEDQDEEKANATVTAEAEEEDEEMKERFIASMVLAGVGDAMGYRNGVWEFNYSGPAIHKELEELGGVENLDLRGWGVSDDQVMHLATAEALLDAAEEKKDGSGLLRRSSSRAGKALFKTLSTSYVSSFEDMAGRAPGPTTQRAVSAIRRLGRWDAERYSRAGGGCGGSMRAMCIGLLFNGEKKREDLISVAIESGRMTHNHPTGFFGALTSALFTAFAVENKPVVEWGRCLVDEILPHAYSYLADNSKRNGKDEWELYQDDLHYFEGKWREYLALRKIDKAGATKAHFPAKWGVKERDAYYSSVAWAGWGGASGHDSVIIAYDALLGCEGSWKELVLRGVLHGGDNDSTGCICGAWFGALYGYKGVPECNYKHLEYRERAEEAGKRLFHDSRL